MSELEQVNWIYFSVGAVLGLFGWTLYWFGVHVIGTALGGVTGLAAGLLIGTFMELQDDVVFIMTGVGAVLGGVLGALLMRMVQNYFFFLLGAGLGALLGWQILQHPSVAAQSWAQGSMGGVIAVVVGGLVGGGLMLMLRRYVISVVTALVGAVMIAISVPYPGKELYIAASVFVFCVAVQTGLVRKFVPGGKKKETES